MSRLSTFVLGKNFFVFIVAIDCSLLEFIAHIAILVPLACKQGIKSKAGAIKNCKEKNYFSPLMSGITLHYKFVIIKMVGNFMFN